MAQRGVARVQQRAPEADLSRVRLNQAVAQVCADWEQRGARALPLRFHRRFEAGFVEPVLDFHAATYLPVFNDLEFPDPVEYAYYAIYNLFRKYVQGRELDDWLIVNQALSSSDRPLEWEIQLGVAIRDARAAGPAPT